MNAQARWTGPDKFVAAHGTHNIRAVATPLTSVSAGGYTWRFRIIAFHSTEGIESDAELIAGRMAFMVPVIVLLSFMGGYWLAGRALVPATRLRQAIAAIAPNELSRRLPVGKPVDEIGALAVEFNSLLTRLDEAQQQNRRFVLEAAHQIRTPLTLVLGEAGNELATHNADDGRARSALGRIRTAAEQMRRRVDELFLLAEAQTGERVRLDDDVELDGLLLECTDLMRGRASALGRTLAIGRAEHVVIRANALLLQEALVEMIENGCRHGTADAPVTVSAFPAGNTVELSVKSHGAPFELPTSNGAHGANGGGSGAPRGGRLGLPIVAWIAHAHGGELRVARDGDYNVVTIAFQPAVAKTIAPRRV
jgi:signal transduction histidine kinase